MLLTTPLYIVCLSPWSHFLQTTHQSFSGSDPLHLSDTIRVTFCILQIQLDWQILASPICSIYAEDHQFLEKFWTIDLISFWMIFPVSFWQLSLSHQSWFAPIWVPVRYWFMIQISGMIYNVSVKIIIAIGCMALVNGPKYTRALPDVDPPEMAPHGRCPECHYPWRHVEDILEKCTTLLICDCPHGTFTSPAVPVRCQNVVISKEFSCTKMGCNEVLRDSTCTDNHCRPCFFVHGWA